MPSAKIDLSDFYCQVETLGCDLTLGISLGEYGESNADVCLIQVGPNVISANNSRLTCAYLNDSQVDELIQGLQNFQIAKLQHDTKKSELHGHKEPDPAAPFAIALSLHLAYTDNPELQPSEIYQGYEVMRTFVVAGEYFEKWACEHIDFAELDRDWLDMLQDGFGDAAKSLGLLKTVFSLFSDAQCLHIAAHLGLPYKGADEVILRASDVQSYPAKASNPAGIQSFQFVRFDGDDVIECSAEAAERLRYYVTDKEGLPQHVRDYVPVIPVRHSMIRLAYHLESALNNVKHLQNEVYKR